MEKWERKGSDSGSGWLASGRKGSPGAPGEPSPLRAPMAAITGCPQGVCVCGCNPFSSLAAVREALAGPAAKAHLTVTLAGPGWRV